MRQSGLAQNEVATSRCLNCGAELAGHFCAACGQRAVPADPSVRELAGDAWQELSGYDGRISSSFRGLLEPGRLTIDYLQGRRARYLSPVRLYLTASVIYFLIAAAAPAPAAKSGEVDGPGGLRIALTTDDRAAIEESLASAPWPLRPLFQALLKDPDGFRARIFEIMPRVFFALLPVFAGIVWLFYRARRFPAALVFAVHLHAFAFLIFSISEAAKFTRSPVFSVAVGIPLLVWFSVYSLRAQHAVFGGRWGSTVAKATAIGVIYLLASIPAFLIILVWASLT